MLKSPSPDQAYASLAHDPTVAWQWITEAIVRIHPESDLLKNAPQELGRWEYVIQDRSANHTP